MSKNIRVRIAPSPTGFLHIGLARTALFNYLFAKKHQGAFILRIEDTDKERSSLKFEKDILKNLKWLGIEWDEGPIAIAQNQKSIHSASSGLMLSKAEASKTNPFGKLKIDAEQDQSIKNQKYIGDYGPYRQSERLDIYAKYLNKLLVEDRAYYCFCSQEELETQKQYQMSIGEPPRYSGKCANLTKETIKRYLDERKPSIIRFRTPSKKISFDDLIRGHLEFDTGLLGDMVIAKSISAPLYNFVVVIDDFEMKISHIIRGEEHISNTPKQILIQEALGFPQPKYAHLPLILAPDRTKLSKRHSAVSIAEYRKAGYLPETLINFMALLGWNPGIEKEIYWLNSLIKEFSLERVQKGGAIFNIKRLDYLNGFYIRQKSIEKLTELCLFYLIEARLIEPIFEIGQYTTAYYRILSTGEKINISYLQKIVSIYQERLKKLSEISELTDFFFKDKLVYDKNLLSWKKMSDKEVKKSLDKLEKILSKIKREDFNKEKLEKILILEAEKITNPFARLFDKTMFHLRRCARLCARGKLTLSPATLRSTSSRLCDRGVLLWPFRVALTNKQASASPFEIAEILGKEKTIKRLKEARGLF